MKAITISKKIFQNDDIVVMPRREYELMKANMVPTLYLKGVSARRLDRRVIQALKAHGTGKSRAVATLRAIR